jgi:bacteriocin-like protein
LEDAKEITKQEMKSIIGISVKMKENLNDSGLAEIFSQG